MTGRSEEFERRFAKVEKVRAAGLEPYPVRFDRDRTIAELRREFEGLEPGAETEVSVRVAGRLLLIRRQGKLTFGTLRDGTGSVQLFVSQKVVGPEGQVAFDDLDLGDWVGVEGTVMTTRKGELSVKVREHTLLAKALRPLPKWHGLSDVDTRYRQRYADLIVNDRAREVFEIRFATLNAIREFLVARGYLEVEGPVLHEQAGGATARPFFTHHNALDLELVLRIALELHLKRLIVAGLEKVFEIGRVFRNEGLSTRHNPEFTMLELYEAFVDYTDIMVLTEELVAHAARAATGGTVIEFEGEPLDLTPPWRRVTMREAILEHAGVDVHPGMPVAEMEAIADRFEVPREPGWGSGKLMLELYEKTTEHALRGPVFVIDYPREVSPLAREHRDDALLVERFEAIVGGRELANAFSELNDPVDQRRRFEAQARLKALGDAEANDVDEDYIRAMEYGMPPCGGLGLGIDRLVMLLAGVSSIREVILFPLLRPERDDEDVVPMEDPLLMRVLVTGMGGELGTRVAQLLEERTEVREILGVDFVPPRRRLRRSEFRRVDPRDREKLTDIVTEFAPTGVAHFGVYEPASRAPRLAAEYTQACTVAALGAAARTGQLDRVALRSGLVVYGRGRGRPGVPDESAPVAPTTPYGRTCLEIEALAVDLGRRHGFPVAALRMAPEAGSHVPSPLGRLLRLPVVPVPALADPAFQLLHQEDAARAMVSALMLGVDGPFNVVGPGAASVWQAVRLGGRVPWPVFGPGWRVATRVAELAGAPVPPHILEIMTKGRTADGSKAVEQLGLGAMRPTQEVCTELFEWAMVTPLRPALPIAEAQ